MASPSLTYTLTNGTTADASQVMQNFNDLLNGYTDGTKDLTANKITLTTTINKVTITTPASSATLTIANGKTLTCSNTLTFTGTDSTSFAFPSTSDTVVTLTATQTMTNKTLTSPALTTPTLGVATATSINGLTITSSTGTLTITNGKTLSCSNTLTFTGTDSSTVACGAGGTVVYTSNKLSVHAATTSAELAGVISDETGSGALVFATSPSLTTPSIGAATATQIGVNITAGTFNPALYVSTSLTGGASGDAVGAFRNSSTNSTSDGNAALILQKGSTTNTTSQIFARFFINAGGTGSGLITGTGVADAAQFTSSSDRRLKENIRDLPSQLANVCRLRPVMFDRIKGGKNQIGFIAQEMQEIYPDAVGEADGMLTVGGWSVTEARLVKAIQELAHHIEALEERIATRAAA